MTRPLALAAVLSALLLPAVAHGADYWPTTIPGTYHFAAPDGRLVDATIDKHSFFKTFTNPNAPDDPWQQYTERDYFEALPSGDVAFRGQEMGLLSRPALEFARSFLPEATFVDAPLTAGKTWNCEVAVSPDLEVGHITYTVVGEEDLATPVGVLRVVVIEVTNDAEDLYRHAGTWKLNAQIGPVELPGGYVLQGIDGYVANEAATWGGVKALHR